MGAGGTGDMVRNKAMINRILSALCLLLLSAPVSAAVVSVCNMPSAATVQVRVYDITATTETVAWTSTGVTERANGQGKSCYNYTATLTAGHDYQIDWQDNSTPVRTAGEVMKFSDSADITELREGNIRKTFVLATVANATRKVAVGRIDYIKIETKADAAADWSAPTSTKYLYFWYAKHGDTNPIKVGENN